MKEFFEQYEYLKDYPEFDEEKIRDRYKRWVEHDEESGEGEFIYPEWLFDPKLAFEYVMMAYAPDSSSAKIKDLQVRKENALQQSKVPEDQWDMILRNENKMIGDMITRLFRELNDFDYELIISGKEAVQTLLEVVRKPMNAALLDDKERNAVKAKKECFEDAQDIMKRIKDLISQMKDVNEDLSQHARKSVFSGGLAERLAEKARKA